MKTVHLGVLSAVLVGIAFQNWFIVPALVAAYFMLDTMINPHQ